MTRKWIVIPVVGFGLIAGSVGAYAAWSRTSDPIEDLTENETGWGSDTASVEAFVRSSTRARDAGGQWLSAEVEYAVSRHDVPRLMALYTNDTPYRANEEAALLTCRGLLVEEALPAFRHLRDAWRGRETRASAWLALDADLLILTGSPSEARTLLTAQTFAGADDAGRLARLALTTTDEATATDLLARAEALAPGSADVRYCRGRFLEATGRPDAAAAELAAALASRPDDLALRWQLAECYRRAGAPEMAVDTWMPGAGTETPDFAWLRAWFWNRVARPVARPWDANAPSSGPLQQVAACLLDLPADQFWDTESGHNYFTRGAGPPRQETYWLRLLAFLQAGREDEAQSLLRGNTFRSVSWQPDLEDALLRILEYRTGHSARPATQVEPARHPFFKQLERLATDGKLSANAAGVPADVAQLLGSREAFSAALLAAGWDEAALRLHRPDSDLTRLPAWYNERLTQAMWTNRSALAALNFTIGQPRTPGVDCVAGELLLHAGRDAEALVRLRAAAADADDATSSRAAWLLAETALRGGRPAEARQTLEAHPRLTDNAAGQALLARACAAEGNGERAEQIYRSLAAESAEARAYLARRAATGGDWDAAGRLLGSVLGR